MRHKRRNPLVSATHMYGHRYVRFCDVSFEWHVAFALADLPLLAGWTEHVDPKNHRTFYHFAATKLSTWVRSAFFSFFY